MPPRRFFSFFTTSFAIALTFGISAPTSAADIDQLVWRGDQATARAVMKDLAKEYAKEKKGTIVLQPFSTLSGLDAVAGGSADIAGSARGKYDRRAEEAEINFVPVALDAAVLITHPNNPVTNVTLSQIHDIYFGRITNWKDLGGPDKPINLYAIASPLDGVEFSLRKLVFRNGDQRIAAPRLYLNTAKLEEAVTLDPAGLGLSTLASVYGNKGVKALSVEGIEASPANVADASYPLYITLYLASRVNSPKQAAIDRFLQFLDSPTGSQILSKHQLNPYTDASSAIARNDQRIAFIDAHMGREAAPVVASTTTPTPRSAPNATLESRTRIAPTADSAIEARANLERAEEKKAAGQAATASSQPAVTAGDTAIAVSSASQHQPVAAPHDASAEVAKKPAAAAIEKKPDADKPAASTGSDTSGTSKN